MESSFTLELSSSALEQSHTAKDYLNWARDVIALVKSEPDGLEKVRLRKGFAKQLMNEALPIGLLASTYFQGSDQVRIKLKVGNQNYDATVEDLRNPSSLVQPIEVTMADDGEDSFLKMFVLHSEGYVSSLGKVTKTGTKKAGRQINISDDMTCQADVLKAERDQISRALDRKLKKNYPPNTLLLLAFNDRMAFDRTDNRANLESMLNSYLPQLIIFHSVAIIGLHQGLFICKRISGSPTLVNASI